MIDHIYRNHKDLVIAILAVFVVLLALNILCSKRSSPVKQVVVHDTIIIHDTGNLVRK